METKKKRRNYLAPLTWPSSIWPAQPTSFPLVLFLLCQEDEQRRGVARARAGERRAHALVLLSEEEDDREGAGGLGRPGGGSWAGPDGPPGKRQVRCFALLFYFYFSYCFLFYVIVFGFIKNARAFPKIMQLTVATVWNISNSKHFSL